MAPFASHGRMIDVNFLNVFEQRVGGLFGATAQGLTAPFSFKKLAKKAAREMEAETFVINGVDTAPALYTILVSSEDDLVMRPLYSQLTNEIAQFIEGQAQGKNYVFVGRPVVRFMADPSLKSGRFSVFAENVDVQTLNRLREEEARFLGADSSYDGGMGGAAAQQRVQQAPMASPAEPMSSLEAGLDVLPQETILDAEEAALGRAAQARQFQNVPAQQGAYPAQAQGFQPAARPAQPAVAPRQAAGQRMVPAYAPQQRPAQPVPVPAPVPVAPQAAVADAAGAAAGDAADAAVAGAARAAGQRAAAPGAVSNPIPRTERAPRPQAAPAPVQVQTRCMLIDRQSGRTYTANAPSTIIGRERTPGGVVLHDPNVSRNHAELSFDGQGWRIRDLNSTNGTLVNDVDIDDCALRDGDLITLGLTNLEFREN